MKTLLDKLAVFLATGAGSGFAPKAPGTFGSIAALPFIWLAHYCELSNIEMFWNIVGISVIGMWSTARVEKLWQTHDDGRIVIDEVAGMFITLTWFPFDLFHVVAGFGLFRLFDIWKPGPIGYIDRHGPGAWGTFFDDVVAGIFAAGILLGLSNIWAGQL